MDLLGEGEGPLVSAGGEEDAPSPPASVHGGLDTLAHPDSNVIGGGVRHVLLRIPGGGGGLDRGVPGGIKNSIRLLKAATAEPDVHDARAGKSGSEGLRPRSPQLGIMAEIEGGGARGLLQG